MLYSLKNIRFFLPNLKPYEWDIYYIPKNLNFKYSKAKNSSCKVYALRCLQLSEFNAQNFPSYRLLY